MWLQIAYLGLEWMNTITKNTLLENNEPILLEEDAEINMVQTHARTAEQGNDMQRPPELQVSVKDILRGSASWINLQRSRKMSVTVDKNNVLRYAVDVKGETIKVPKALRPWIVASTQ